MPIRKLSPETTNQIAAGEVVENPASVVKELVENALDAGAKRIRVLLKKGGLQEITVIDDGHGIAPGELRLAVARHATSKIQNIDDLEKVSTLGFRGEALPSMASVSKLSITSRQSGEGAGYSIYLEGGVEKNFQEVGFPTGTRVTVEDLFFNTPARRKFLKGTPAETAKVSRMMQLLALSRPDVSFTLEKEKGIMLETPGDGKLINVILTLFGHELRSRLLPLRYEEKGYRLDGYVSIPSFFRNNRSYQFFFVNGRVVQSKPLRESLDQSYARLVTSKKYPLAFLFLTVPPGELDVNVHPSKTEIRLYREEFVRSFLVNSLNSAFQGGRKIPALQWKTGGLKQRGETLPSRVEKGSELQEEIKVYDETGDLYAQSREMPQNYRVNNVAQKNEPTYEASLAYEAPVEKENLSLFEEPHSWIIIGQAFGTYILIQKGEELFFMDQHAAHERILWERILQQNKTGSPGLSSQLALPLSFELPLHLAEDLSGKLKILEDIGLELEQFGNNTFIIRGIPLVLQDDFAPEMILDLLDSLTSKPLEKEDFQREAMMQLACKAAIKAHKTLTLDEIKSLLKQLRKCGNPFFCPHGRPVFFKMPKVELEKFFKRR